MKEQFESIQEVSSIEYEIESVKPRHFLDSMDGGKKFGTPFHQISQYNEHDWKILHTPTFLNEHPEWKEVYDLQNAWLILAHKASYNQSEYGEGIDNRNRVLDQIRFDAVKGQYLNEEMIDKHFAAFGYRNSKLKKQLLDRYEQIRHVRARPQFPSEGYTKTQGDIYRDYAYTDKLWAGHDIANNLRATHEAQKDHQQHLYERALEKKDVLDRKKADQLAKEQKIKDTYMDINPVYRGEVRQEVAEVLKQSRSEHASENETFEDVTDRVFGWHDQDAQNVQIKHQQEVEIASRKLQEARAAFDIYTDVPKPTPEDIETYKKEDTEMSEQKINNLISSFKVEYDEININKEIEELEKKITKILVETPYMTKAGEPNEETLYAFKKENNVT